MRLKYFSYRYAKEILEHENYISAYNEINKVIENTPLFIYPEKSSKNHKLDVVQQVMNTYFDRRLSLDLDWEYHPLATTISNSGLTADFRKRFDDLTIQVEVQFGNMSRWYSDIFKFQTAYSQNITQMGLCIIPTGPLATRVDSNVVNFERVRRELPFANLSISLPILVIGIEPDANTRIIDLSRSKFKSIKDITGKGKELNKWRIVNNILSGINIENIGPESDSGNTLTPPIEIEDI